MAPKKKEQQKMSLGAFLTDEKTGSWADEMEDMPVYSRTSYGGGGDRRTYNSSTGAYGNSSMGGYSVREELPLPDKPPYTVHLGNLSFDATGSEVTDFFAGCECINVRIIEDKLEMKPKGFGYAEFSTLDGLKQALTLNGTQFAGRNIRISVADPPKDRDRPDAREFGDWSRKGPLPDLPGRGSDRRNPGGSDRGYGGRSFGDGGSDAGGERRDRRDNFADGDGKVRDFGNWERRGPLSPLAQPDRGSREGGRPRTNDGPSSEAFSDRKVSPAAWGESRAQDLQDGPRPPRNDFQERPHIERQPTAAEQDSQWRSKMRPDPPQVKSPVPSHEGSGAPSSPATTPSAPAGRPKLNLAKRTVSEAQDPQSSLSTDAKASPFGAARPIDTAAKEREIEEKRLAALREKKEAEEKAKEEKRDTVAAKAPAESTEGEEEVSTGDQKDTESRQNPASADTAREVEAANEISNGVVPDDKAGQAKDLKAKPSETGAWRRPAGNIAPSRDDSSRGQRGGRGRGRGDGSTRGSRHYEEGRGPKPNSNGGASKPSGSATESEPTTQEEDGWSTVSKQKKSYRGGSQASRPIPS